jgi:hypothetical protein
MRASYTPNDGGNDAPVRLITVKESQKAQHRNIGMIFAIFLTGHEHLQVSSCVILRRDVADEIIQT